MEEVVINVNKVGTNLDTQIGTYLTYVGLPECFGKAYPDVLDLNQTFDLSAISAHADEKHEDINLSSVISPSEIGVPQDRFLTAAGKELIEARKKMLVEMYVKKIKRCSDCGLFDKCNELTRNYAQAVSMNLVLKLNRA